MRRIVIDVMSRSGGRPQAYLRDSIVAAKRIEHELLKLKNPTIPPPG